MLLMPRFDSKYYNEEPDKAAVEKNIAALSSKLDVYDVILGKQKYLAGNVRARISFTIHFLLLKHCYRKLPLRTAFTLRLERFWRPLASTSWNLNPMSPGASVSGS